jgi:DNA-binding FrmR family transcriptional regulator
MYKKSGLEKEDIIHRLNRIEGQVRGIKGMIEKDLPCNDVLNQVASIQAALSSVTRIMFEKHLKNCISFKEGEENIQVNELMKTVDLLFK